MGWFLVLALPAGAHQHGKHAVDQLFLIDAENGQLALRHLVHWGEVPSYREIEAADRNQADGLEQDEKRVYTERKAHELTRQLRLVVNGEDQPLEVARSRLEVLDAMFGMKELRLTIQMAPLSLPANARELALRIESKSQGQAPGAHRCLFRMPGEYRLRAGGVPRPLRQTQAGLPTLIATHAPEFEAVITLETPPPRPNTPPAPAAAILPPAEEGSESLEPPPAENGAGPRGTLLHGLGGGLIACGILLLALHWAGKRRRRDS